MKSPHHILRNCKPGRVLVKSVGIADQVALFVVHIFLKLPNMKPQIRSPWGYLQFLDITNLESWKAQHNASIVDVSDLGGLVETGDLWRFQSFCCHQQWLDRNLGTSSLWRSGTLMQPEVKESRQWMFSYLQNIHKTREKDILSTTFDCIRKRKGDLLVEIFTHIYKVYVHVIYTWKR